MNKKWPYVVAVIIVVVTAVVLVLSWSTAPKSAPAPESSGCLVEAGVTDTAHCSRLVADLGRRHRLTEEQRAAANAPAAHTQIVLADIGGCPPGRADCTSRPPNANDAGLVVESMASKGFTAQARLAGDGDPAPAASLLYAVQVTEHACVIGYLLDVPTKGNGFSTTGTLPSGRCLD